MDNDTLIQALAADDLSKVEQIGELLRSDNRCAEINEEYQAAAKAYIYWRDRNGNKSPTAIQYCGIMRERVQELREILNLPTEPGQE
jgi:hypothetical protein